MPKTRISFSKQAEEHTESNQLKYWIASKDIAVQVLGTEDQFGQLRSDVNDITDTWGLYCERRTRRMLPQIKKNQTY